MKKIKVYHFHNGSGGGVLSVIKNLLLYKQHDEIENNIIYTINKDTCHDFTIPHVARAFSQQVFYYSTRWNFYHTCKQLSKLFPEDAVIVAHDWLELGMMSNLGLSNKVVCFLHGDYQYYYDLAIKHMSVIDTYVCVSDSIAEKLKTKLKIENIFYLRFPVKNVVVSHTMKRSLSIVFIGRFEQSKGFHLLPEIAEQLAKKKTFTWELFGEFSDDCKQVSWPKNIQVHNHGNIPNEKLIQLLPNYDYYILPSKFEGMPVSLIEAMKAGLIPIVNNIDGGIQELVIDGQTGYKIEFNNINKFADKFEEIENDKALKFRLRENCLEIASRLFNAEKNTNEIENQIISITTTPYKRKQSNKTYGSRLDQKWMPNFLTSAIRRLININK